LLFEGVMRMRKVGFVLGAGCSLAMAAALAACSDGAITSNNGSVTVNTTVIGGDLQNSAEGAGNMARNGVRAIGNGLGRAGQVIENNAKAAWNEIKETAREIRGGGEGEAPANSTGN